MYIIKLNVKTLKMMMQKCYFHRSVKCNGYKIIVVSYGLCLLKGLQSIMTRGSKEKESCIVVVAIKHDICL